MPQMAPISWLVLFIIFSATLILFTIMNYFMIMPKTSYQEDMENKLIIKSLNWKW
uniref:ATP synthase complex subunit 8 n=1 Tax=Stenopelmatus fuscus TaxID=202428 RepID=A0A0N7AY52_STEFS|nr:ATP synthase F0 subunit 8 [Stenopelmatus fuscus]AJW76307.1 ATP synthase F0 subunit 8 [Stenopelmatus fuscus]